MRPGHENCGHDIDETVITLYGGRVMRRDKTLNCYHDHMEEVRASDVLGNGSVVADYCQCCDAMIRREEYA